MRRSSYFRQIAQPLAAPMPLLIPKRRWPVRSGEGPAQVEATLARAAVPTRTTATEAVDATPAPASTPSRAKEQDVPPRVSREVVVRKLTQGVREELAAEVPATGREYVASPEVNQSPVAQAPVGPSTFVDAAQLRSETSPATPQAKGVAQPTAKARVAQGTASTPTAHAPQSAVPSSVRDEAETRELVIRPAAQPRAPFTPIQPSKGPRSASERGADRASVHIGSIEVRVIAPPSPAPAPRPTIVPAGAPAKAAQPTGRLSRELFSSLGLRQG